MAEVIDLFSHSKEGYNHFNTITELYKTFLPVIIRGDINVFDCCFSVESFLQKKGKKKPKDDSEKDVYVYHWDGFANIRCGRTEIQLHSPSPDPLFLKLEAKLRLVKEKIDLFLKLIEEYEAGTLKEEFSERTWLNPEKDTPDYTGYIYVSVKPNGDHRLYVADCHRSITLFIEYYTPKAGRKPTIINKETLPFLRQLSGELEKSFGLIEAIRQRFNKNLLDQ